VRAAAVEAAANLDPTLRIRLLRERLGDPVRSVRIQAARALAPLPAAGLSGAQRAALEQGVAEWIAAQRFNADRPESHANLGALRAELGDSEQALAEYAKALEIDPHFTPAAANRADLLRALGREAEAEASLREAIARNPRDAVLHHVLGLSLIRQNRPDEALAELGEAVRLAPADARLAYVYAVALHDLGRRPEAIRRSSRRCASAPTTGACCSCSRPTCTRRAKRSRRFRARAAWSRSRPGSQRARAALAAGGCTRPPRARTAVLKCAADPRTIPRPQPTGPDEHVARAPALRPAGSAPRALDRYYDADAQRHAT
jgi:tetratricopeptide (TPR) repeat protein